MKSKKIHRRDIIKILGTAGIALASAPFINQVNSIPENLDSMKSLGLKPIGTPPMHGIDPRNISFKNNVPPRQNPGFMSPMEFLTHFDYGTIITDLDGKIKREFNLNVIPQEITIAHNLSYSAWTFNGIVPGPTLRATVGDIIKINFGNGDSHSHTLHFHGVHPADMDGVFEIIPPGGNFTYEFTAEPFGLFPYHCHVLPLSKHISKGLYGTLIIDPKKPRSKAKELVMIMNGFDMDFDGGNEFYTVNGIPNYYAENPINLKLNEQIRIYLVNMTEFDLINSFHLHANMFYYYPNGTMLSPSEFTDTVMQCQGMRGILEFKYNKPGKYLFHAHQSEFAELGWLGIFNVES